jgi:AAA lid domain
MGTGFKEKLLLHCLMVHTHRAGNFGNGREIRNLFESVITNQATRIATAGTFGEEELTKLETADLRSDFALSELKEKISHYTVKCSECGETYGWLPDVEIVEGKCTACSKSFVAEFGEPVLKD